MTEIVEIKPPSVFGRVTVIVLAGILFAYPFWTALGNLLNLPSYFFAQFGVAVDPVLWGLLIGAVALPVMALVGGIVVTWKRGTGAMALVLMTGFAVVNATSLSILAFEKDIELRIVIDFLTNG